jgi:anthranilate synthase/aminodeoxychorismate synthase-like glutamine amidotransferase
VARRVLVVDNHDSFTHLLADYLTALGARCQVVPSDAVTAREAAAARPDGILLSAGPGRPEDAGATLEILRQLAGRLPILGVCLGHQAIAMHFGAAVTRARTPLHGKATPIFHDGQGIFRGLPNPLRAARYHSLVADRDSLPACLEVSAVSRDAAGEELMALRHVDGGLDGVQFHPESALSEHGHALLSNWLEQL